MAIDKAKLMQYDDEDSHTEDGWFWLQSRRMKQAVNAESREAQKPLIEQLREAGFEVRELNGDCHLRINERLDIYPTNQKWHDVQGMKRGVYKRKQLIGFVTRFFAE